MLDIYDIYESYFNVVTGLPVMAVRNIREGNYLRYNEIRFIHEQNKLLSLKSGEHDVPENIMDILSVFYFARTYLFKHVTDRDVIQLNTFFDNSGSKIKVKDITKFKKSCNYDFYVTFLKIQSIMNPYVLNPIQNHGFGIDKTIYVDKKTGNAVKMDHKQLTFI